jgi:PAS domain S-box-containing protein
MAREAFLTGVERFFDDDEIIVSKTDIKGRMTYTNDVFLRTAGYTEKELRGQPHSIIRHPHMPRSVFALLWRTIENGHEIFAYVINRCKNGDHYWVYAHVTPSFNRSGEAIGYHSTRRVPDRSILDSKIKPLYNQLLTEENKHSNRKNGMEAATEMFLNVLKTQNMEYDEFVASL